MIFYMKAAYQMSFQINKLKLGVCLKKITLLTSPHQFCFPCFQCGHPSDSWHFNPWLAADCQLPYADSVAPDQLWLQLLIIKLNQFTGPYVLFYVFKFWWAFINCQSRGPFTLFDRPPPKLITMDTYGGTWLDSFPVHSKLGPLRAW